MKKFLFTISLLLTCLCTSCKFVLPFLIPGYWQSLIESIKNKPETVSSYPTYYSKYEWEEITVSEAIELWETESYKNRLANPPKTVNLYMKDESGFLVYKNLTVKKFDNNKYDNNISKWIYTLEGHVPLNYYIPQSIPENTVIKIAKNNPEFVLFQIPDNNQDSEKILYSVYKNGFLMEEYLSYNHYILEY